MQSQWSFVITVDVSAYIEMAGGHKSNKTLKFVKMHGVCNDVLFSEASNALGDGRPELTDQDKERAS